MFRKDSFVGSNNTRFMQQNYPVKMVRPGSESLLQLVSREVGSGVHMVSLVAGGASPPRGFPLVTSHLCLPTILLPAIVGLIRCGENDVLLYGLAKVV